MSAAYRLVARRVPINEHGRVIGEAHHRAKLADATVERILDMAYGDPPTAATDIARELACARRTVRDIVAGRRRAHSVCGYRIVLVKVPV